MTSNRHVDGGWAWVVLAASFLIHIMSYGMAWSTGVYNVVFLEEYQQAKAVTAWAGALPTAVMYGIGPISSMLTNKFGFRPVIVIGGLLSFVGLSLSYFASSLYYLFFTFGVIAGAGNGLAYIPSIAAVSCYFDKKISIAAGIAASGVGLGNFLYPPLIRWLIGMYSWKESLLILGAVNLHICLFGAVMRPIKRNEIKNDNPIIDLTPFKKKGYLMLCINNFLFCCGVSALYLHITALAEWKGISPDKSAMLVSGLGGANLFGRIGYGLLGQHPRFNAFAGYGASFFLSGVSVCVAPFLDSFAALMCCAIMFGLLSGCFGTLLVTILIQLLGLHRFANGYGCLLLFEAAGQLIGGSLAGAMFDLTQSYTPAFLMGGGLVMLSSLIMIQPYCYIRHHTSPDDVELPVEKQMLADTLEVPGNLKYPSHRDLVQMTVSMESLAISHRIAEMKRSTYSLHVPKAEKVKSSTKNLPINKRLESLKRNLSVSTETV